MKEKIQRVQERFLQVKEARRKQNTEAQMKASSQLVEENDRILTKKRPTSAPSTRRPPSVPRSSAVPPSTVAAPVTKPKTSRAPSSSSGPVLGKASSTKKGKKPVKYDKTTGNISDKFQLLLAADME
jgi:hypothetical protein